MTLLYGSSFFLRYLMQEIFEHKKLAYCAVKLCFSGSTLERNSNTLSITIKIMSCNGNTTQDNQQKQESHLLCIVHTLLYEETIAMTTGRRCMFRREVTSENIKMLKPNRLAKGFAKLSQLTIAFFSPMMRFIPIPPRLDRV